MRQFATTKLYITATIVACIGLAASIAAAQNYPLRPVRMIVGFPPGGGPDVTARVIGQKLSENLGQPVVIENRPGAAGYIAIERVARAAADGYTLLMMSSNDTALPSLRKKLSHDLTRDLAAVTLVTAGPMVLVTPASMPVRNVKDLVALGQSQPGKLTFGSGGIGGTVHLTGELFTFMGKMKVLHVPYKGSADILAAMLSGSVDFSFPSITIARPLLDAGKIRALAVTSTRRASSLPAVPTIDESGLPGFDRTAWYGVAAPGGVQRALIDRLNGEIGKVVNTPEMRESFSKQGLEVQTNTPEQFARFIRSEIAQNAKLVAMAGVKPE